MNTHPLMREYVAELRKSMLPFLAEAVDVLSTDPDYSDRFEGLLGLVRQAYPEKPWPKWAAGGTLRFNRTVIRAELDFRRTGEYARKPEEADAVNEEIYNSVDVMEGYYLVGLLLSYFTWIHHSRLLDFFQVQFLAGGRSVEAIMEWGVGHGLFTLLASRAWPHASLTALDISPFSLEFARRLLKADGTKKCPKFALADILDAQVALPNVDRLICSELMEHVPDPEALVKRIADVMAPGGRAFVTAAINAPQPDHISLFRSSEEVTQLIAAGGLTIEASLAVVHPHNEGRRDPPTVLAMVIAHKGDI